MRGTSKINIANISLKKRRLLILIIMCKFKNINLIISIKMLEKRLILRVLSSVKLDRESLVRGPLMPIMKMCGNNL